LLDSLKSAVEQSATPYLIMIVADLFDAKSEE
jgi:hypothetical protein